MNKALRFLMRARLSDEQREAQLHRIIFVETNIMLPIKVVAILGTIYFYRAILGADGGPIETEEAPQAYFTQLKFYSAGNLVFWLLLLAARVGELWPRSIRVSAFWLAMLDNLFLSGLIFFTGGLDSVFYWLYVGLMIRTAVIFPVFWQQALLNLSNCIFYTLAVLLTEDTVQFLHGELFWLRLCLLLLVGACCWGVFLLIDRERRRAVTKQEFQLRTEKLAASGRLAAEVAHQLKNPLGIINNAAFLLQRQTATNDDARESVQIIRDEVARADSILTRLMDYSRLSEGRIEPVDLNAVLDDALAQARPESVAPQVRVVKQYAAELPPLAAQRAQLEEGFLNLIRNAFEAMPGEGTLTLRTRYAGAGQIDVEIADTGAGIAPDNVPKIFEAFFTTKPGGTGLGLAILKNSVETYGGTVTVQSSPGHGTQFRVRLPVRSDLAKG